MHIFKKNIFNVILTGWPPDQNGWSELVLPLWHQRNNHPPVMSCLTWRWTNNLYFQIRWWTICLAAITPVLKEMYISLSKEHQDRPQPNQNNLSVADTQIASFSSMPTIQFKNPSRNLFCFKTLPTHNQIIHSIYQHLHLFP